MSFVECSRRWGGIVALVGATLLTLGWAVRADATVMEEVPLERMIAEADAIVHAVVERTDTQMVMRQQSLEPHTLSTLRVREWLRGGEGSERVTVREIGGEWQGGGLRIDGTPTYRPGEEVVVFLRRDPAHVGHYRTYGMVQGKFIVRHGVGDVPSIVLRDLDGVGFARWTEGRMTVQAGQSGPAIQLENFLDLLRGAR